MLLLVTVSTPVLAEVCDKVVGEHWQPADGPAGTYVLPLIWLLMPSIAWWGLVGVLCLLIVGILARGTALTVAARLRWLGYLCSAFLVLLAWVSLYEVITPDDVIAGAVKEGCMSIRNEWLNIGAMIFAAALYSWAAFRVYRLRHIDTAQKAA
jgi:hypothetical protein